MVGTNSDPISTRELQAVKIGFDTKTPISMQAGAAQAACAVTCGAGTGADATTPSGAEHNLVVDDVTALVALINELRQCLIDVGIIKGAA